jgi:hypothetical protein
VVTWNCFKIEEGGAGITVLLHFLHRSIETCHICMGYVNVSISSTLSSPRSHSWVPLLRTDELMKRQYFRIEKMKWKGTALLLITRGPCGPLHCETRPARECYTHSSLGCCLEVVLIPAFFLFFGGGSGDNGAWMQGLHPQPLHQSFYVKGFFKIGSLKLFPWTGFKLWSSWSLSPE